MDPRQHKVLTALVREYIRQVEPISSEAIVKRYHFGVSSATIRNELFELTKEGFLSQSHPSAGRIPTNRAYRLFANAVMNENPDDESKIFSRPPESFGQAVNLLSRKLQALAMLVFEDGQISWDGISELFSQPDFSSREQFENLAATIEKLQERAQEVFDEFYQSSPQIFVGEETPIVENPELSLLVSAFQTPSRHHTVLLSLGPTRMPYDRNWQALNNAARVLSKLSLR